MNDEEFEDMIQREEAYKEYAHLKGLYIQLISKENDPGRKADLLALLDSLDEYNK